MLILSLLLSIFQIAPASAGWVINCENYCTFKEFNPNCQGIYWEYPDGYRNYSEWSGQYAGCLEKRSMSTNPNDISSHLITPNYVSCNCGAVTTTPPAVNQPLSQATRDKLALLRDQMRTWTLCAPVPQDATGTFDHPFKYEDLKTCRQFKLSGKPSTFIFPARCEYGQSAWNDECNYHGDLPGAVFWMCMAGDTDRCQDIKRSQNPTTGAWYRNEHQRIDIRAGRDQALFSRDHTIGVLGYLTATQDKPSALKWLTFIRDNPKIYGQFSICPQRPSISKPAELSQTEWDNMLPDDRCDIRPNLWGLFYYVYKHVGFTDSEIQNISTSIYNSMMFGKTIDIATLQLTANSVPAKGSGSYQTQLIADELQIRLAAGQPFSAISSVIQTVNNRTTKLHPRFHFLSLNRTPTEYGAYLIQKYCRPQRPPYGYWASSGNTSAIFQNAPTGKWYRGGSIDSGPYQYFGSYDSYGRNWLESGHECINWINLYLGNSEERDLTCDAGETLIDGACRTVAFQKPIIPPVAGLGYSLTWPWESKVTSILINRKGCFSTGVVDINDPNWNDTYYNWCVHLNLAPLEFDNASVAEYVDPNPMYPGIYYPLVGTSCPYGGSKINNACRVYAFTKPNPSLYLGVNYWVDNNPAWPGVYYAATSGSCPYGGVGGVPNCRIYEAPAGLLRSDRSYFIRRNAKNPGIYHYPVLGNLFNYNINPIRTNRN
jgi:hypothetical protein